MNILVIGSGTMGAGIAETAARQGLHTCLYDLTPELSKRGLARIIDSLQRSVDRGKLSQEDARAVQGRLSETNHLGACSSPTWIIEAIPEDLSLKKTTFARLGEVFPGALLASNTSSLSLTEIAAAVPHPERVIGLHFFNPAPVMALLEIVQAEQTSAQTLEAALELSRTLAKQAIVVRDTAGFATSRLGIILGMEAIRMVESGVASVADIDKAMELGYRHPMGPLKLTDLVGLDVRLAIAEHLTRELGPQFTPPPLLRRLVRAGKLGKKTGQGFYKWDGDTPT